MWPVIFTIAAVICIIAAFVIFFRYHTLGPSLIALIIGVCLGGGVAIHHHMEQPANKPRTEQAANQDNQKANRAKQNAQKAGNKANQVGKNGAKDAKQKAQPKDKKQKASYWATYFRQHPKAIIPALMIVVIVIGALCSTSSGGN